MSSSFSIFTLLGSKLSSNNIIGVFQCQNVLKQPQVALHFELQNKFKSTLWITKQIKYGFCEKIHSKVQYVFYIRALLCFRFKAKKSFRTFKQENVSPVCNLLKLPHFFLRKNTFGLSSYMQMLCDPVHFREVFSFRFEHLYTCKCEMK